MKWLFRPWQQHGSRLLRNPRVSGQSHHPHRLIAPPTLGVLVRWATTMGNVPEDDHFALLEVCWLFCVFQPIHPCSVVHRCITCTSSIPSVKVVLSSTVENMGGSGGTTYECMDGDTVRLALNSSFSYGKHTGINRVQPQRNQGFLLRQGQETPPRCGQTPVSRRGQG